MFYMKHGVCMYNCPAKPNAPMPKEKTDGEAPFFQIK